ncbi:hypothetical protein Fleli_2060 [Bernardetia litoralis DSM 6794]|uniref:Lipoprotein n=1 Tax=Bernardetia litoralis (strain ATCC 23117 / DSM 6794 / NBRC 15988 / NCIMB 1366 / Fx l1 / Sio-4) TaxID=880071 RepID=I4AKF8_BERLS|nr:hypothetical protein [Bernardetia litoralis]AFM04443.1 hypothetical protein Fleli_2060 [Bernardetia litoralis DSM 6794]
MKNIFFIIISFSILFLSACTSSNLEKENTDTFIIKENSKISKEDALIQPNKIAKEDIKKMKYEDLMEEMQGGIVNVKIDDEDFAEKDYIFETLRNENTVEYDEALKTATIMVANYQNTNTNLVITAIGDKKGNFPIISSSQRSATVTFYYNNGLANIGGSLKEGVLNIDIFDEEKGYARGRIEGKTEEGSSMKATFEIRAERQSSSIQN